MIRIITLAVAAGIASGLIYLAPASGSLFGLLIANLTHLPLFLAGLGLGVMGATIAAFTGAAVTTAFAQVSGMLPYALGFALPVAVVVRQALLSRTGADGTVEWYPVGRLLALATAYAAALFVVFAFMMAGEPGGFEGAVRRSLDQALSAYVPGLAEADRAAAAAAWSQTFPAMVTASWLLTFTINGSLGQAILVRAGHNLRPSPRYAEIVVPQWLMVAIALAGALWLVADGTPGYTGRSLMLIFAIPFFFQGLGVAHVVSRGWPGRPFALTVFYMLILFLPRWSGLVMVTGAGAIESLIGLRQRFAGTSADEEED